MTTNEELTTKVEALEARVGQLERLLEAMGEMTREQSRHTPSSVAKLADDAKRWPMDRATAIEATRLVMRPLVTILPAESRPKVVAEGPPAHALREFVRLFGAQFGEEHCAMLGIAAGEADSHALTWADLGVGADGSLS